mmetsp:Transcript_171140/g.416095  ORF Transcript_171140/g.416095 Transcript_171140/m.416095 type:complete len:88 (+) Transcript_171140:97-360(+)
MELANEVKRALPDAKVSGFVGRSSSFEIYVNDHIIFSKLGAHFFPDSGDVVGVLKDIAATGKMPEGAKKVDMAKVTENADEGGCAIQ